MNVATASRTSLTYLDRSVNVKGLRCITWNPSSDVDKNSMKYHNSAVDPQPNKAGCRVIASAIYDVCAMEGEINSKD